VGEWTVRSNPDGDGAPEKSVVYVTSDTIKSILLNHRWDHSKWDLANMYLLSLGAKLLGKKAARIVGMSEETTCYVSPDYFAEDDDPFADFIVHDAAHIFHNCKRRTIGLRETRGRRSGCSTSSSRRARRSPTPARRTPASSRARKAQLIAVRWQSSTARSGGSRRSAWTLSR
jgi:hypothetical protein